MIVSVRQVKGLYIVTKRSGGRLRDEGKDEEAEKMDNQLHSATGRGLPWKKEHEAMVLYYRSEINGLLMDSHESGLEIVYVPYMDKIVLNKRKCSLPTNCCIKNQ